MDVLYIRGQVNKFLENLSEGTRSHVTLLFDK